MLLGGDLETWGRVVPLVFLPGTARRQTVLIHGYKLSVASERGCS